ncbi:MAG: nascent polypeptide-associated complex protein [Candidatus Thermoplasmatota archaeon]|jgi:nascent polypeptide-associated complex subunit alpha|nr:nascent polypeptide-associated complex protein [Candidatus Thermoplasmatota archaeon]
MLPGRMNPKQMERMMRKMGLNMEEMTDVKGVVITTATKEIRIIDPQVTVMNVHGERSYQIQGKVEEKTLSGTFTEEDIELVMAQTGASRERVVEALTDCGGEPAEAIIKLLG